MRAKRFDIKETWKLNSIEYANERNPDFFWESRLKVIQTTKRWLHRQSCSEYMIITSFWRFNKIKLRVWSWLRTNAGGAPNTCKSNEESFYTEFFHEVWFEPCVIRCEASDYAFSSKTNTRQERTECKNFLSGGRVSNTWRTCLTEGDNSWKRLLIPHNV